MSEEQKSKYKEAMESLVRTLGSMVDMHLPDGMSFALVVFDAERGGNTSWSTNASQEDMIAAMTLLTEWLRHGADPKKVLEALKTTVRSYESDIA